MSFLKHFNLRMCRSIDFTYKWTAKIWFISRVCIFVDSVLILTKPSKSKILLQYLLYTDNWSKRLHYSMLQYSKQKSLRNLVSDSKVISAIYCHPSNLIVVTNNISLFINYADKVGSATYPEGTGSFPWKTSTNLTESVQFYQSKLGN